jgi:hypothetical protein
MSYSNIIDPLTGTISREYLPPTHQNGITQITTGTPDDLIIVQVGNVANINLNQDLSLLRANISERFRFGDQAEQINDEVIIDQGGIDVKNGDITIQNGTDQAILQAGDGDRLTVNAATVAYTSELPTVALTGGSNITITNNSSGSNYSFQVAATGDLGVASIVSTDPNIVVSGTENVSLALANDLYINNNIEAMNGIFNNSINISGEAIIQAGIDLSANGSECVLFTFNNALTVNEEQVALLSDIPAVPPNTTINAGTNISVSNPSTNTFTINNTLPATSITAGTGVSVSNPSTNTFTISNTGVSQLTAGAGVSVSAGTGNITVANTGVLAVNAGTGIQVSGLQSSRQVAIANIGTAGVYAYPTSITTNAQGQVSAVSAGSAPVASVSGSENITIGGTATAPVVNLDTGLTEITYTNYSVPGSGFAQGVIQTGGTVAGGLNIGSNTAFRFINLPNAPNPTITTATILPTDNSINIYNGSDQTKISSLTTDSVGNFNVQATNITLNGSALPTGSPPTINGGTGISVANPSANTYTITNTAPYTAPTVSVQSGGNYTIQLSDLDNTIMLIAPANNQSYTITLPNSISGATAGQVVSIGRSPVDTTIGSSYTVVSGIRTLATIGTSTPFSNVLQFEITNASGGVLSWALLGQRLSAGSNISLTGTTDIATINCTLPATSITAGPGITVGNPSTNTFTITNSLPACSITAGNNTTVSNPSNNTFTIGSNVPYWGAGTSSSSFFLYNNPNFGNANVAISMSSLLDKTGLYVFNINASSVFGGTYPNVGGGAISIYLTGSPVSTQPGVSLFISSYDMNAVSGFATVSKQFYAVLPASGAVVFNARPYDGSYNSNFTIWNVGLTVQCIYLGDFSN